MSADCNNNNNNDSLKIGKGSPEIDQNGYLAIEEVIKTVSVYNNIGYMFVLLYTHACTHDACTYVLPDMKHTLFHSKSTPFKYPRIC